MKTAFINFLPCTSNEPTDENFTKVGINSGNIVFSYSLANTIKCESVTGREFVKRAHEFDNVVIRHLITIHQESDLAYFENIFKAFPDKPIVPISVGLQSPDFDPDFKLHPRAEYILKDLSERAILGVRGNYTASILEKHGITNIRIVGCPSMYCGANHNRKIFKKPFSEVKRVLANYRTISNKIDNPVDIPILRYLKNNAEVFIEQTHNYAGPDVRQGALKDMMNFIQHKKKYFFIFEDWYNFVKDFDFCIGGRFHGNVVPLLAGVPALFMYVDSRTKEMTDFYEFPTININDFDPSKPLEYYYDLADYTNFNNHYAAKLDNFIEFCLDNNLELNFGMEQHLYRKLNKANAELSKTAAKLEQLQQEHEALNAEFTEYKNRSVFKKIFGSK